MAPQEIKGHSMSFAEQLEIAATVARRQFGKESKWDIVGGAWQQQMREHSILPPDIIAILEQPYRTDRAQHHGESPNDHLTIIFVGTNFLSIENHTKNNRQASGITLSAGPKGLEVNAFIHARVQPNQGVSETVKRIRSLKPEEKEQLAIHLLDFIVRNAPELTGVRP